MVQKLGRCATGALAALQGGAEGRVGWGPVRLHGRASLTSSHQMHTWQTSTGVTDEGQAQQVTA
jgi:hypothetical protein